MKAEEIKTKVLNGEISIFDDIDLIKTGISKLQKKDLLELITIINKQAIESTDCWEGG